MTRGPTPEPARLPGRVQQAFAFFGGAVAYAAHVVFGIAVVPWACTLGTRLPVHAVNWLAAAGIVASGLVALRVWRAAGTAGGESPAAWARRRTRLVGTVGALLSALFLAIVAVAEAHVWSLGPCPL